jgi:hypothetical protein
VRRCTYAFVTRHSLGVTRQGPTSVRLRVRCGRRKTVGIRYRREKMVVVLAIYSPGGINTPGGKLSTFPFSFLSESSPFLLRLRDPGSTEVQIRAEPAPSSTNTLATLQRLNHPRHNHILLHLNPEQSSVRKTLHAIRHPVISPPTPPASQPAPQLNPLLNSTRSSTRPTAQLTRSSTQPLLNSTRSPTMLRSFTQKRRRSTTSRNLPTTPPPKSH